MRCVRMVHHPKGPAMSKWAKDGHFPLVNDEQMRFLAGGDWHGPVNSQRSEVSIQL